MADFEHEQMKSLFESLADKLDKTEGDILTSSQIAGLKGAIKNLATQMGKGSSTQSQHRENRDFVREFFQEWDRHDPLRSLRDRDVGRRAYRGDDRHRQGTILGQLGASGAEDEKAHKNMRNQLGKTKDAFSKLGGATLNFHKRLDGTLNGLATAAGGFLGLGAIFKFLDADIDSYRGIAASAEGSIGSIGDLRRAAHDAAMSTTELADAMLKGTTGARLLGAMDFAKLNSGIRTSARETGMFGMTLAEIREKEGSYLEMLRNQGDLRNMDLDAMQSGFVQLISINQNIAGILGKTRDEALKAAEEQARDANTAMSLRSKGLSPEQMTTINQMLGNLKDQSPGMHAMVTDLITRGGITSDLGASTAAANPELVAAAESIRAAIDSGNIGSDFARNSLRSIQAASETLNNNASMQAQYGALGGLPGMEGIAEANSLAINSMSWNFDKQEQDQSRTDDGATAAMTGAEEVFARLRGSISSLIDQFYVPFLTKHGPDFLKALQDITGGIEKMTSFFKALSPQHAFEIVAGSILAFFAAKGVFFSLIRKGMQAGVRGLMGNKAGDVLFGTQQAQRSRTMLGRVRNMMDERKAANGGRGLFSRMFNSAPQARNARAAREMANAMDEAGKGMLGGGRSLLNSIRGLGVTLNPMTKTVEAGSGILSRLTMGAKNFFSFIPNIGRFVGTMGEGLMAIRPLAGILRFGGKILGPLGLAVMAFIDGMAGLFMTKGNIFQKFVGGVTNMLYGFVKGMLDFTRVIARLITRGITGAARMMGFRGWADRKDAEISRTDAQNAAEYTRQLTSLASTIEGAVGISDVNSANEGRRARAAARGETRDNPAEPADTPEPATTPTPAPPAVEAPEPARVAPAGDEEETERVREWDGNGLEPAIERMRREAGITQPERARLASEVAVTRAETDQAGNPGYVPAGRPERAQVTPPQANPADAATQAAAAARAAANITPPNPAPAMPVAPNQTELAMSNERFAEMTARMDPIARMFANMGRGALNTVGTDIGENGNLVAAAPDKATTPEQMQAKMLEHQVMMAQFLKTISEGTQNQTELMRNELQVAQNYYQQALRLQEEANRRLRANGLDV